MAGPLSHIAAVAAEFRCDVAPPQPGTAERLITLRLVRPSGTERPFHLLAKPRGDFVAVREDPARASLPAFCPERHINDDGTFCLFWRGLQDVRVVDRPSAKTWLKLLVRFLQAQLHAEKRQEWPSSIQALPHGQAARHQIEAERIARLLGDDIYEDLMAKRLVVVETVLSRPGLGRSLRLLRRGRKIAAMWQDGDRIANLRQACFCGAGKGAGRTPIRGCGQHARLVAALIRELFSVRQAEQRYWASVKDRRCCGTMDSCPLRRRDDRSKARSPEATSTASAQWEAAAE